MTVQWTFLVTLLYCEIFIVLILLLPFISPIRWQSFFKSRIATTFTAKAQFYFNFIILVFTLLFLDAIRDLHKYSNPQGKDLTMPQAEDNARMKQFRSQRNIHIAGFALFLWFVIKRLVGLLAESARASANATAARSQTEGALRGYNELSSNETKKTDSPKTDAELAKLKQEAIDVKNKAAELRERFENSVSQYNQLKEEHRKLEIQFAIAGGDESLKNK